MIRPKISLVIVNDEAADYLPKLFNTIKEQNGFELLSEIIFVDNCSGDDSVGVAKGFGVENMYVFNERINKRGVLFQKGADLAKGEYVIFAHSDIYFGEGFFENLVEWLDKNQDADFVNFEQHYVDGNFVNNHMALDLPNKKVVYSGLFDRVAANPFLACSEGCFLIKKISLSIYGISDRYHCNFYEYDLLNRMRGGNSIIGSCDLCDFFHYFLEKIEKVNNFDVDLNTFVHNNYDIFVIEERLKDITALNTVINQKEENLIALDKIIYGKDKEVASLNEIVKEKDKEIVALNQQIIDLKKSVSYKIGRICTYPLRIIYDILNRLIIFKFLFRLLASPLFFLRKLSLKNLSLLFKSFKKEGVNKTFQNVVEVAASRLSIDDIEIKVNNDHLTMAVFVPFNLSYYFGGGIRVLDEYKALSKYFNIVLVMIDGYGSVLRKIEYGKNLVGYAVPITKEFYELLRQEESRANGHLHDILLTNKYELIPDLVAIYKKFIEKADIFVSVHPYFFKMFAAEKTTPKKIFIYEAQDVNYDLKRVYLGDYQSNIVSKKYVDLVHEVEEIACHKSRVIMTVSKDDNVKLKKLYGVEEERLALLPNGVDIKKCKFIAPSLRGLDNPKPILIFMGSAHTPNIESVDFILNELAPGDPNLDYLIVGNLIDIYKDKIVPSNVKFSGMIDADQKEALLMNANLALNPMFSGSGTNLKVLEYCACGLPLISTKFGMRGYEDLKKYTYMSEKKSFLKTIHEVLNIAKREKDDKAKKARKLVQNKYDWNSLVSDFKDKVESNFNK